MTCFDEAAVTAGYARYLTAKTTVDDRALNRQVLAELETDDHVQPGEFTTANLVVGTYRGAPPRDVPYLMDRLVAWIAQLTEGNDDQPPNVRFFGAFLRQRPQVEADSGRSFLERGLDDGELARKIGQHAQRLRALARKYEGELTRIGSDRFRHWTD